MFTLTYSWNRLTFFGVCRQGISWNSLNAYKYTSMFTYTICIQPCVSTISQCFVMSESESSSSSSPEVLSSRHKKLTGNEIYRNRLFDSDAVVKAFIKKLKDEEDQNFFREVQPKSKLKGTKEKTIRRKTANENIINYTHYYYCKHSNYRKPKSKGDGTGRQYEHTYQIIDNFLKKLKKELYSKLCLE